MARRFSSQKQWLDREYKNCKTSDARQMFVRRMGNVATFYKHLNEFVGRRTPYFGVLQDIQESERQLAEFCLLYLEKANHRMARTILSLFYSRILDDVPGAASDFAEAVKAVGCLLHSLAICIV